VSARFIIMAMVSICCMFAAEALGDGKPRVIATTDGEVDDRKSMVRFLMYANEWDIEGLIYSSSCWHWKGDAENPGETWHGETWIEEQIDAYAQVYPNLKKHDATYPTPEYLKECVFVGNIALTGDMREATPGSDRIVEVLLEPDPSPVWLQAWGGANTIARALKTIEEEHPDRMAEVSRKARIFLICEQDKTYSDYIKPQWPRIETLYDWWAWLAISYGWEKYVPKDLQSYIDDNWMLANIKGHGALSAMYPDINGGKTTPHLLVESDSPAFMHQINVGLRSMEDPSFGGWAGRFQRMQGNEWVEAEDRDARGHQAPPTPGHALADRHRALYRWIPAFQNDWAARADWCVKSFKEANHPPIVKLAHGLDLHAAPGETIELSARGTTDPDGDEFTYRWWRYADADSCAGEVEIENADKQDASFVVPEDCNEGDTIHVICEVTDNGTPPLTRYQRVIIEIAGR